MVFKNSAKNCIYLWHCSTYEINYDIASNLWSLVNSSLEQDEQIKIASGPAYGFRNFLITEN